MTLACSPRRSAGDTLVFWDSDTPSSADPLDADQILHSIVFGPLHATLVDGGRKGQLLGGLAETWRTSPDFTEWSFTFRPGLTYETGEPVEPGHLAATWERNRKRMAARKSSHPVFDRLAEDGISAMGRTLTLRFKEPYPTLLNQVSDEILGLAHPSCLDSVTGDWRCGTKPISSGPYRLVRWDTAGVTLRLRDDFPAGRRHERAFREIRIVNHPGQRASADVIYSLSRESDHPAGTRFVGSMDSAVAYARCQSWTLRGSPCADMRVRRALRDRFYAELGAAGFIVPRTFFPLSIPGITPVEAAGEATSSLKAASIAFDPVGERVRFLAPADSALERAAAALGAIAVRRPVSTARRFAEKAPGLPRYEDDVVFFMVEITLADPLASVRFMFKSKEGARLPDPTGKISAELKRPKPDLQAVNARLLDDAIIWPVAHAGFGVWVAPHVDSELANDARVVTPLHWLGRAD